MAQAAAVRRHPGHEPIWTTRLGPPAPEPTRTTAAHRPGTKAATLPAGTVLGHALPARGDARRRRPDRHLAGLRPGAVPLGAGAPAAAGRPGEADLLAAARRGLGRHRLPLPAGARRRRAAAAGDADGARAPTSSASTPPASPWRSSSATARCRGSRPAWVVREVADALSGVHASALLPPADQPRHRHHHPDRQRQDRRPADRGGAAARRDRARWHGADDPELVDVTDLGRLLYAALVCPLARRPRVRAARRAHRGRRWMTPRQVRAGVSPALDDVCDQILGDPPRHRAAADHRRERRGQRADEGARRRRRVRRPGAPAAPARARGSARTGPAPRRPCRPCWTSPPSPRPWSATTAPTSAGPRPPTPPRRA